jgi:hypothetical protein
VLKFILFASIILSSSIAQSAILEYRFSFVSNPIDDVSGSTASYNLRWTGTFTVDVGDPELTILVGLNELIDLDVTMAATADCRQDGCYTIATTTWQIPDPEISIESFNFNTIDPVGNLSFTLTKGAGYAACTTGPLGFPICTHDYDYYQRISVGPYGAPIFVFTEEVNNQTIHITEELRPVDYTECCFTILEPNPLANGVWEIQPVPIPAAVWLFGSGLGLLGWFRRRQS